MPKISVIIVALNEAEHIHHCLASVKWAEEIIVVDSGSQDETVTIARAMGAKVLYKKWEGYAKQKQFALVQAANEWVVSLDADEIVSPELREAIQARVGKEPVNGYYFNRLNHFLKQPIQHCGWYPDQVLRCFLKSQARLTNVQVHEGFIVEGNKALLEGLLLHYSYNSLSEYLNKMNRYTTLEIQDKLNRLANKPIRWYHLVFNPLSRFLRMYVGKQGYKDGLIGLVVCVLSTLYLFALYGKLWERQQAK